MPDHPRPARQGPATQPANRPFPSMMVMMRVAAVVVLLADDLNHIRAVGAFLVSIMRLPFRAR
jgi:hypothetical protein